MQLPKSIIKFFNDLKHNNNRDWFAINKTHFKEIENQVKGFGNEIKNKLNEHDNIDQFKLFRIYKDVRFSKDKTPYKTHFGLYWNRVKPMLRGGYYLHISPKNNFLACGFWNPNPADLKRIRKEFVFDSLEIRTIIESDQITSTWGSLIGDELKTAPRNFDLNHPNIDLIRKKQFIFRINFLDKEVYDKKFINKIDLFLKTIRPFLDYMSEILTTDENGQSII
ncbi:MAG: DUF2461 domain-containing protein [Flavobacteriaceae bacterium]|nr:DUF2461 domain-containing protein [Flavobacteriaceae bacterium]